MTQRCKDLGCWVARFFITLHLSQRSSFLPKKGVAFGIQLDYLLNRSGVLIYDAGNRMNNRRILNSTGTVLLTRGALCLFVKHDTAANVKFEFQSVTWLF